jgi:hypothetical protein
MTRRAALLLAAMITLAAGTTAAETHKFALVIGNNQGHDDSESLRFAERDATKMHRVLTELGGFKPKDTRLLTGADALKVRKALEAIERRLEQRASRAGDRTLLLLYYSGHAEGEVLELGKSSLEFGELREYLKRSPADVRLGFIDSCRSGRLISMKGGRRGPGFDIRVTDEITSRGYAIITSSAQDELSQESAEIRGAIFTHYLVSALRGAGDESGDGKVTLSEAYQYAYTRTLARTSRTVGGSQHPMYHFRLEGQGEIVLTNTDRTGSDLAVTLPESGRLVLLDGEGESIVAETDLKAEQTAVVAVRPGEYLAYLITPEGAVREARATVSAGSRADLTANDFETTQLEIGVAKGGLFSSPLEGPKHRLSGGGLWRRFPLEGGTASFGASLHYRLELPGGWQPAVRLAWATRDDVGVSTGYHDVGAMIGIGRVFPISFLEFHGAIYAGYEHLLQDERLGQERHTSGFDYLGLLGLDLPIGDLYVGLEAGAGGRVFQVIGKGWVHRFDFQAVLGLGWKWEVR